MVTRETVEALLGSSAGEPRGGGGDDDRSARMLVRQFSPSPVVSVLPVAVVAALDVIEASDVPLRARQVCEALGGSSSGVQAMRNRLGRLAKSGLVTALEPGLYVAAPGRAR